MTKKKKKKIWDMKSADDEICMNFGSAIDSWFVHVLKCHIVPAF